MENKIERLENIEIKYDDHVLPSRDREVALINNVNMWLSPLIKRFNEEKAVVVLRFKEEPRNHIHFENISDDLQDEAIKELKKYLPF